MDLHASGRSVVGVNLEEQVMNYISWSVVSPLPLDSLRLTAITTSDLIRVHYLLVSFYQNLLESSSRSTSVIKKRPTSLGNSIQYIPHSILFLAPIRWAIISTRSS